MRLPCLAHYNPKQKDKIYDLNTANQQLIRACYAGKFSQNANTIRYCPRCAAKDIEKYGVSCWHLEHQIPDVQACFVHDIWLSQKNIKGKTRIDGSFLPVSQAIKDYNAINAPAA